MSNDLLQHSRNARVIDFFGLTSEEATARAPVAMQRVIDRVKPERDQNHRKTRRDKWWLFSECMPQWRRIADGLDHVIATPETSKHRIFARIDSNVLPEHPLIGIGLSDTYYLGVLSSRIHITWSLASGGTLEDRPRYNKSRCFDPFPFPDATDPQQSRIRELGEQLDAHRRRQQELHPTLTMTGIYNVLEKLRAGESLTNKEQEIHEQGLVSVLRQIHDDLDAAVADAYGWPADLPDEEILARLVALNHERAEEERRGLIRWLRPEFQNPSGVKQQTIVAPDEPTKKEKPARTKAKKQAWPRSLSEQAGAVHAALGGFSAGTTAREIAKTFGRATEARVDRIEEILETLATLGKARELGDDRYVGL